MVVSGAASGSVVVQVCVCGCVCAPEFLKANPTCDLQLHRGRCGEWAIVLSTNGYQFLRECVCGWWCKCDVVAENIHLDVVALNWHDWNRSTINDWRLPGSGTAVKLMP